MQQPLALLQRRFHPRDVYAAKPLFLATRRSVDSVADPADLRISWMRSMWPIRRHGHTVPLTDS
jgi:hypothetical protein